MKMKIRNKAAFTDEVTPLEEENAQVSYENRYTYRSCSWKTTAYFRSHRAR